MDKKNEQDPENSAKTGSQYVGIGFQMMATIAVFTGIGYWLDQHYKNEQSICTALFSLLGVLVSLFQVIRQLRK